MKPQILIDTAPIPGSTDELHLLDCGDKFVIKLSDGRGGELMSSRMHGSEDALGKLPCRKIAERKGALALIGGLGMGFTLAAALGELQEDAQLVVAELVPGVVRWNQGPLGEKAGYPLEDPRASVHEGDVMELMRNSAGSFDAIMLDVDNGPSGLTHLDNSLLYNAAGVRCALDALRPAGVLAYWSAGPDERFSNRLLAMGIAMEELQVYAHGKKGTRHTIWMVRKNDGNK